MTVTTDDNIASAGLDKELITRLKQVQVFKTEEKKIVLSLMNAFIA